METIQLNCDRDIHDMKQYFYEKFQQDEIHKKEAELQKKADRKKELSKAALKRWYENKGKGYYKKKYSYVPKTKKPIVETIQNDEMLLKQLIEAVGLDKLTELAKAHKCAN
jgi:hypothetical protein